VSARDGEHQSAQPLLKQAVHTAIRWSISRTAPVFAMERFLYRLQSPFAVSSRSNGATPSCRAGLSFVQYQTPISAA
jgi:hypothetical protein